MSLEHGGKLPEAEALYRRCLEVAKKLVGDHPETGLGYARNLSVYFYGLRAVLIKQGKLDEAEGCRREALASARNLADSLALRNDRENPDIVVYRAEFLARLGRWSDAARDLTRARELLGDDRFLLWRSLARILFQAGELDAYRRFNKMSLERFAGTKDLNLAQDIAMNCLIRPSSGADLAIVSRMAETECALGGGSGRYVWYELCKGLADYRQGHFDKAIEWLQKVLADAIGGSPAPAYRALPGDPAESQVGAYSVLAMAYQQLQRAPEARAAMAKAKEIAEAKLAKPGEDDLSYTWPDWIMAHALMDEAKEFMEASPSRGLGTVQAHLPDRPQPAAESGQPSPNKTP